MALGVFSAQINMPALTLVIMVLLLGTSWLVSKFEVQYCFLLSLSFLLPFSFEYNINDTMNINFPTEPMLAIALFSIGWDILRKPGFAKQII